MITKTRKKEVENLKRCVIYISQERDKDGSITTVIDEIGDTELKEVYDKSILRKVLEKEILNPHI